MSGENLRVFLRQLDDIGEPPYLPHGLPRIGDIAPRGRANVRVKCDGDSCRLCHFHCPQRGLLHRASGGATEARIEAFRLADHLHRQIIRVVRHRGGAIPDEIELPLARLREGDKGERRIRLLRDQRAARVHPRRVQARKDGMAHRVIPHPPDKGGWHAEARGGDGDIRRCATGRGGEGGKGIERPRSRGDEVNQRLAERHDRRSHRALRAGYRVFSTSRNPGCIGAHVGSLPIRIRRYRTTHTVPYGHNAPQPPCGLYRPGRGLASRPREGRVNGCGGGAGSPRERRATRPLSRRFRRGYLQGRCQWSSRRCRGWRIRAH